MKELQRFVSQHQQNSVQQFYVLQDIIAEVKKIEQVVVKYFFRANTPKKSVLPNSREQSLSNEEQEDSRREGQQGVVKNCNHLQLHWGKPRHQFLQQKNPSQIHKYTDGNRFIARERVIVENKFGTISQVDAKDLKNPVFHWKVAETLDHPF
jgi:hypothetical protein